MPIDNQELSDLKVRCQYANTHGFLVGLAAEYAKQLAAEAGVSGMVNASPEGLLWLISEVEAVRSAPVSAPPVTKPEGVELLEAPKAKGKPKAEEPKAEEPKAEEPKAEEPKAEEPKAAEPKAAEPKAAEPKAAEPKPAEPKPAEPKPAEPKK